MCDRDSVEKSFLNLSYTHNRLYRIGWVVSSIYIQLVGALGELPKDQVTTENIDSTYVFPLRIDFDGNVDKIGLVFAVARAARRFQGWDLGFSRGGKIRLIESSLGHPRPFRPPKPTPRCPETPFLYGWHAAARMRGVIGTCSAALHAARHSCCAQAQSTCSGMPCCMHMPMRMHIHVCMFSALRFAPYEPSALHLVAVMATGQQDAGS